MQVMRKLKEQQAKTAAEAEEHAAQLAAEAAAAQAEKLAKAEAEKKRISAAEKLAAGSAERWDLMRDETGSLVGEGLDIHQPVVQMQGVLVAIRKVL